MKIKLTRKDNGQTFNQWCRSQNKERMPGLNSDGQPFYVDMSSYYLNYEFLSKKEWKIEVATEKENDKWVYKEI